MIIFGKFRQLSCIILVLSSYSCLSKEFYTVYKLNKFNQYKEKRVLINIDSNSLYMKNRVYYPIFINRYGNNTPWGYVSSVKDTVFFIVDKSSLEQILFVNNINALYKKNIIIDNRCFIAPEPFSTKMSFTLKRVSRNKKVGSTYNYSVNYINAPVSDYIYLESVEFSPLVGIVSVTFLSPFGKKEKIKTNVNNNR